MYEEKLLKALIFKNYRFVEKTKNETIVSKNDSFLMEIVLKIRSFSKRSFSKTIVFKSLTIVNDKPSLTIDYDDPSLMIVNDDPLLTIVIRFLKVQNEWVVFKNESKND